MSRSKKHFISPRILVLFLIVSVLGIVLKADLWTVPENRTIERVKVKSDLSGGRSPASLSSVAFVRWQEPDRLLTLELDCSDKTKTHQLINVHQLRLNGSCLKNIKRLTNENNGYTANIFKINNSYTTDFLSLNEGTNKLKLEWVDGASGNLTSDIEIVVKKQ